MVKNWTAQKQLTRHYQVWAWKRRHLKQKDQTSNETPLKKYVFPAGTSDNEVTDFLERMKTRR